MAFIIRFFSCFMLLPTHNILNTYSYIFVCTIGVACQTLEGLPIAAQRRQGGRVHIYPLSWTCVRLFRDHLKNTCDQSALRILSLHIVLSFTKTTRRMATICSPHAGHLPLATKAIAGEPIIFNENASARCAAFTRC